MSALSKMQARTMKGGIAMADVLVIVSKVKKLVRDGYRVRLYVPYGTQWYPYFMRRLAERPDNLIFILKNFFRG